MRCLSLMMSRAGRKDAFTLIELLVAITVLVILLGILLTITNTVAKTVVNTSVKLDTFATSRAAFDLMSQKLSQATLNTYWDYDNPITPANYFRQSDLQFLVVQNSQKAGYGQEVYFVTPAAYSTDVTVRATSGLLNACGFFVSYGADTNFRPGTVGTPHYRYRLMQGLEPTENLATYANWPTPPATSATASTWTAYWTGTGSTAWGGFWKYAAGTTPTPAWISTIGNQGNGTPNTNDTPVANNVIALIVWPRLSPTDDKPGGPYDGSRLSANYTYDSQASAMTLTGTMQPLTANQLPPTVQITMIVISEASATRLNMGVTPPTAIENALSGKFTTSKYTNYQADLLSVSGSLTASHIAFEILNTSITMKESKWSDNSQ